MVILNGLYHYFIIVYDHSYQSNFFDGGNVVVFVAVVLDLEIGC